MDYGLDDYLCRMKPLILVTNDDGINSPGIKALVDVAREIGEVVVVAPDSPQSAKGHAITVTDPLRLNPVELFGSEVAAYECSGTPVDCVKLAKNIVLQGREIALCLSGVNHGSNASINIIYSGTLSAAMEGSLEGIRSVGFSLLDYSFGADFDPCKPFIREIITKVLLCDPKETLLLNVNFPKLPFEEIKGIKVCRQAEARWVEEFQEGQDPRGTKYYWLTGRFENYDNGDDTDIYALRNGYVSVVPSKHDLTDYDKLDQLYHFEDISIKA